MEFKLSDRALNRFEEIKRRYPKPESAVMQALFLVQEEHGCISDEAIVWVAEALGISPIHVRELVTFYTMYRPAPLGRYHIQLCRTLSCAVCGTPALVKYLEQRLGTKPKEVSADGFWSYELVECLGSCGSGPAAQINDTYFEKLTPERLGAIMDRIEKELPDLSFSTAEDKLGDGLAGEPRSQVYRGPGETA